MSQFKQMRETKKKRASGATAEERGISRRDLRRIVKELLEAADFSASLYGLQQLPPAKTLNVLIDLLSESQLKVRLRAAEALGALVAQLIEEGNEKDSRVLMQRLLWGLTEESGNIIWGAPEAMGEVIARCDSLAREYAPLLISFINPAGNFLEHEPLLCGVARAIARVAKARPELLADLDAARHLKPLLDSPNQELHDAARHALAALG